MHHDEGGGSTEFDGEVAIGNAVERILGDRLEAQEFRGVFAVDRVGRAGERGGSEGRRVDAVTEVKETRTVALEHLDVGEHVVAEGHGLGNLHVREARHDDAVVLLGLRNEHFLEVFDALDDFIDFAAEVEADVGGNLVVAGASGVKALAGVADEGGKTGFNVEMNVLELELPLELAGLNLFADLSHAALDVFEVFCGNHADLFEHGCVSNGTININERHALVEVNARGVAKNKSVNRFREAAGPGLLFGMQGIVGIVLSLAHETASSWGEEKESRDFKGRHSRLLGNLLPSALLSYNADSSGRSAAR